MSPECVWSLVLAHVFEVRMSDAQEAKNMHSWSSEENWKTSQQSTHCKGEDVQLQQNIQPTGILHRSKCVNAEIDSWKHPFSIPMSRASPKPLWRSTHQISRSILHTFLFCNLWDSLHYGCFQKYGYPQIIHFNRVSHYKPSILGYPYFWKHP